MNTKAVWLAALSGFAIVYLALASTPPSPSQPAAVATTTVRHPCEGYAPGDCIDLTAKTAGEREMDKERAANQAPIDQRVVSPSYRMSPQQEREWRRNNIAECYDTLGHTTLGDLCAGEASEMDTREELDARIATDRRKDQEVQDRVDAAKRALREACAGDSSSPYCRDAFR
jgi:hypothetical protein